MRLIQAALVILSTAEALKGSGRDICNVEGVTTEEQAVICYAGNFLTKMLTELNGGQNKTVEHVRVHLLPYLGGVDTLQALTSDEPDNPNCTVCYTDVPTSKGLTGLRDSLKASELQAYDSLNVCYARLSDAIMWNLPKSKCGVYLKGLPMDPYDETLLLLKRVLSQAHSPSLCPASGAF
ncbi:hypothetical protein AAMO2058_000663400 [Amorphochlora amoebiformis]